MFGGEKIVHYNVLDDGEKLKSPLISYQIVGVPQPPHRLLLMVNELYIGDRSDVKMQLRLPNVGEAKLLHYREAVETSVRA